MLHVHHIAFAYDKETVIRNIGFTLEAGQNLAVIGESGCGKSTLLKLIYGLYDLDQGEIFHFGEPVLGPKFHLIPGAASMKYLAQDFDLMPYISVAENVGKYLSNTNPEEKERRIWELLEMVEMTKWARTKVQYLSGGQQQRVALARVLALEPQLLLLDEPFSNIDSFRKGALRRNLFGYLKAKGISCIIATHDSIDALSFSDEALVMKDGMVVQHGSARSVYEKPRNKYVASLFGEVNELPARIFNPVAPEDKSLLLYATELYLTDASPLEVIVRQLYFKGHTYLVKAAFGKQVVFFENPFPLPIGQTVYLTADAEVVTIRG